MCRSGLGLGRLTARGWLVAAAAGYIHSVHGRLGAASPVGAWRGKKGCCGGSARAPPWRSAFARCTGVTGHVLNSWLSSRMRLIFMLLAQCIT